MYTHADYGIEKIGVDNFARLLTGDVSNTGIACAAGPVGTAKLAQIAGIVVLPDGNLLAADRTCHAIWHVNSTDGSVTLFSGQPVLGGNLPPRVDGPAGTATFQFPQSMGTRPDGSYWVVDSGTLRSLAVDGSVTTPPLASAGTILDFVVDATTGITYLSTQTGLKSLDATGTTVTSLVPASAANSGFPPTLGNVSPNLGDAQQLGAITLLGPKQLLMRTGQTLTLVTLP
jgi:hypothetical protein